MSLLRRGQSSPATEAERRQRAEERAARSELVRQARAASKEMRKPEPAYGLYTSAFLLLVGLVSFLSTDVVHGQVKGSDGKFHATTTIVPPHHSQEAIILVVLAAAAAVTIYWRRRLVTGIAFMLAAAIGVGTPLPKGFSDGMWLAFLVPAAYVLWMLIFRMNKEQKAWLDQHRPARASSGAGAARSASRNGAAPKGTRARSGRSKQEARTASGRPLPAASSRYTPPAQKTRAGGRKP